MLFNSLDFAIFLPIVFVLYWFTFKKSIEIQNSFLLVSSYVFYGWWDWRFLILIFSSSIIDYFIGKRINITNKIVVKKILLASTITINIGFLCFFKYFNFFIANFTTAFAFFGNNISPYSLNIILPVGISFYTFQTLSYSIDVYRKKIEASKDLISFLSFVSFFPQLVAGPIERASNLLPQFSKKRVFVYQNAVNGMQQILWGLFKKMVIADNCAIYVNEIFNNYSSQNGSTLVLGAVLFAFQIYGDFSGYSDIAIGVSKLFGFKLKINFNFPYFSRDIAEFWRRWHISLSTWFRDYLYIPLGGSKGSKWKQVRNVFIIFIVSGFWHGANWTFIVWGLINALFFIPLLLSKRNRNNLNNVAESSNIPTYKEFLNIITTFIVTTFAWVFFRAENLNHAFKYFKKMFDISFFALPKIFETSTGLFIFPKKLLFLIFVFVIIEWVGRKGEFAIAPVCKRLNFFLRYTFYVTLIISIYWFSNNSHEFIYFQF